MALSSFLFDPLYCQEDPFTEEVEEENFLSPILSGHADAYDYDLLLLSGADESDSAQWASVHSALSANESRTHPKAHHPTPAGHPYLRSARRAAIDWILSAAARHGFSAVTALLAVNYLDRCFLLPNGLRLQEGKPWMGRLSAVACLSLAAKVEETRVPLLLDLQLGAAAAEEDTGYVFEPKTVRRMELLVLSTLGWRMNPVTPLSFVRHALPRLLAGEKPATGVARLREVFRRCEAVLLSVIADWRWVRQPPSAWAVAVLAHVVGSDETNHLFSLLNVPKGGVEDCCGLILESIGIAGAGNKRKVRSLACDCPASPSGVLGSTFSYDSSSSNDSWAMWPSSVSSSPEPPPPSKRANCIAGD